METVLLQINNNRAYKLIEDLEALDIVKILEKSGKPLFHNKVEKLKPSEFVGCISEETAKRMLADTEQSRDEWERSF